MSEFVITLLIAAATCVVTLTVTKLFDIIWNKAKNKNNEVKTQAASCDEKFSKIHQAENKLADKLDNLTTVLGELKENGPKEYQDLKKGVQAILRRDMLTEYKEAKKKRYASVSDKQNFDNMYNAYHNLGENGVMDGVHDEYMLMPTEKNTRKTSARIDE